MTQALTGAVGITAHSSIGSGWATSEELTQVLRGGVSQLASVTRLPESSRELGFCACVGAVSLASLEGRLFSDNPSHTAPNSTRQLQLGWAALLPILPQVREVIARRGKHRVGLLLGTSTGGITASELALASLYTRGQLPADYSYAESHAHYAAPHAIAERLGIGGPVYVLSSACASSAKALLTGRRLILTGVCDAVLVGGVDTLCELTVKGFHSLGVLRSSPALPFAEGVRAPSHAAQPLLGKGEAGNSQQEQPETSAQGGMNVAEGAAWCLLENREAPVYLLGAGESSDAYSMAAPEPKGLGALAAMRGALQDAGLSASQIALVNAHGTGTQANDAMESQVLQDIVSAAYCVSTKALHGHSLGAAGAIELACVLSSIENGNLPGGCGVLRTPQTEAAHERWIGKTPKYALSNSFAFGGANVCLALGDQGNIAKSVSAPLRAWVHATSLWTPYGSQLKDLVDKTAVDSKRQPLSSASQDTSVARSLQTQAPIDWRTKQPAALLLGRRQRARATFLTRLCAEVLASLATRESLSSLPMVYGSAFGQSQLTAQLLERHWEGELSPARFQASVHSAPAGLLSIELSNHHMNTTVAAGRNTASASLIEALSILASGQHGKHLGVIVADEAPPPKLCTGSYAPLGAGFLLSTEPGECPLGMLEYDPRSIGVTCASNVLNDVCRPLRENPVSPILELLFALNRVESGGIDSCEVQLGSSLFSVCGMEIGVERG